MGKRITIVFNVLANILPCTQYFISFVYVRMYIRAVCTYIRTCCM